MCCDIKYKRTQVVAVFLGCVLAVDARLMLLFFWFHVTSRSRFSPSSKPQAHPGVFQAKLSSNPGTFFTCLDQVKVPVNGCTGKGPVVGIPTKGPLKIS